MLGAKTVMVLEGDWSGRLRLNLPRKLRLADAGEVASEPLILRDTFDQDLRRAGRVLVQIGAEWLLVDANGQLTEGPVAPSGYVTDLPPGALRDALAPVPVLRSLLPLAEGTGARRDLVLLDDEDKTQARLSLLTLSGQAGTITLASLRGLRGYDKALGLLRDGLAAYEAAPGAMAEQVHATLAPDLPRYVAKPDVPMGPDDTVFDASTRIIQAYIAVARENESGVIADLDTEFLHDYRVALRKVRSVLSLFRGLYSDAQTAMLKAAFSEHMAHTGRLRDLDVYLLDKQEFYDLVPATLHGGLDVMFADFVAERKDALRAITRRFRSKSYAKEIGNLEHMFANTAALHAGVNGGRHCLDYARELIWKRYRKVCKIARAIDDTTPDEEVHELRIHCKKLRYLMEFFMPMFDKAEVKQLIKALKRLQDVLGLFNDYSVQQDSLRDYLDQRMQAAPRGAKARAEEVAVAQAVGALIAVLHRKQLEQRAQVVSRFAAFDSDDTRTRFATQFQVREG